MNFNALLFLSVALFSTATLAQDQSSGSVVFYRDSRLLGGGVAVPCVIDGKIVTKLKNGTYSAAIPLAPGKHVIQVQARPGDEFPYFEEDTFEIEIGPGSTQYLKVFFDFRDMSAASRFRAVPILLETEAQAAIKSRKLTAQPSDPPLRVAP